MLKTNTGNQAEKSDWDAPSDGGGGDDAHAHAGAYGMVTLVC